MHSARALYFTGSLRAACSSVHKRWMRVRHWPSSSTGLREAMRATNAKPTTVGRAPTPAETVSRCSLSLLREKRESSKSGSVQVNAAPRRWEMLVIHSSIQRFVRRHTRQERLRCSSAVRRFLNSVACVVLNGGLFRIVELMAAKKVLEDANSRSRTWNCQCDGRQSFLGFGNSAHHR
jgi:hypothetical protein